MIENIKVDENKKAKFKVDSRLITQILGSEIIESHSIAFAEQIKNAQDAGASEVTIDFSNIKNDEIIITDNGNGMSELEVEEDWFLLGNSKKDGEASTSGGKGIGRLSLFKIGDSFQVKTSNGHEVTTFSISNKELMKEKTESFETDLYTEIRNESIGTQIKIKELDNEIILKEIELELNNLLSDDNKLDLKIIYPVDFTPTPFFTKGDIEGVVPFSASIFIDFDNFNKIEDISYKFTAKLQNEIIYTNTKFLTKFTKILNQLIEKKEDTLNIGNFSFLLANFFFDNKEEKFLPQSIKDKSIREYFLKVHQGINIYRNGFKLYGHGSEDWLKLAENRVSKPGENIDNKLSYGVITLDNEKSILLKEKSNREGFIRNESSKLFKDLLTIIVKQFGQDRYSATREIRSKIQSLKNEEEHKKADITSNGNEGGNSEDASLNKTIVENNNKGVYSAANPDVKEIIPDSEVNKKKILKITSKKIDHGDTLYLKDDNIVNSEFMNELKLISSKGLLIEAGIVSPNNVPGKYIVDYIYGENSESLNLIINERKIIKGKKSESFFKDSNHFNGEINLSDISELVFQLDGLKYSEKNLLYIISFRAILESTIKNYISKRPTLELSNSFKDNVLVAIDDLLIITEIKGKKDSLKEKKTAIHKKFKGRDQLSSFLTSLKVKFDKEKYDKFFHSLTHNPATIEESLALELANDIILPIHVLVHCLEEADIIG